MPTPPGLLSAADARAIPEIAWYHTLDLPGGVLTPGLVDCRPIADRIALPPRLDGLRILDVGTWDGFWAFELERRGAQVTTLDLPDVDGMDWPPSTRLPSADASRRERMSIIRLGEGFRAARELLGSQVQAERMSVYDVSPETVGTFDIVFVGSILVHLRDPVRALAAIRSVAKDAIVLNESIELLSTLLSPRTPRTRFAGGGDLVLWWHSNLAGVRQLARSAGLDPVRSSGTFFIPAGPGAPRPSRGQRVRALRDTQGREMLVTWRFGIPHVSLYCEPVR